MRCDIINKQKIHFWHYVDVVGMSSFGVLVDYRTTITKISLSFEDRAGFIGKTEKSTSSPKMNYFFITHFISLLFILASFHSLFMPYFYWACSSSWSPRVIYPFSILTKSKTWVVVWLIWLSDHSAIKSNYYKHIVLKWQFGDWDILIISMFFEKNIFVKDKWGLVKLLEIIG